jgi:uncharacterized protein (TIGR03085 family)
MSTNYAQQERAELCDLFLEVGPDVPTLCEGWTAADLAAHLVVRERRPDAALGILAAPFERHGDRVRRQFATRPFGELVELVRSGPPSLSPFGVPGVDRLANTMEYFIHHEDVRRTNGGSPRALDPEEVDQLWDIVSRMSKLMLRKSPAGVELRAVGGIANDGRSVVAKRAEPTVVVTGAVGELALFIYGRQDAAVVDLEGPASAVDAVRTASFGI